jgi:hypothetical protein
MRLLEIPGLQMITHWWSTGLSVIVRHSISTREEQTALEELIITDACITSDARVTEEEDLYNLIAKAL